MNFVIQDKLTKNMPDQEDKKSTPPLEGEVTDKTLISPQANLPIKGRGGNIFIGTLNLMAAPAKALVKPLHRHYHRKYHGKYKHAKKLFFFDLALVGVGLALLALSLYFFLAAPSQNYLGISLKPSEPVVIGKTQDFTLQMANLSNQPLANLVLNFEFPNSFALKTFPANFNLASRSLFLDWLKEKQKIDLTFGGQVWGPTGENQKIIVRARFIETKNQKNIEQIALLDFSLNESALKTEWNLPEQIFVGQDLNLVINYHNNSNEKIAKAIITPVWPDDFEIVSSNLNLKDGDWVLANLNPGEKGQIILTGFLRSLPRPGNLTFTLQTFLEHENKQFLQSSFFKILTVRDHGIILKANLGDKKSLPPGEETVLKVAYQNTSEQSIKNFTLFLRLPVSLAEENEKKISRAEIKAGESGVFEIPFKLRPNLGEGAPLPNNLLLNLRPFAVFNRLDLLSESWRVFAPPLNIKISSTVKFHAEARYFSEEGDQLGRGPLPPRAGQTTKYWINWFVTAAPNALKKVSLSGRLPAGMAWTGKTNVAEGEPVKFDAVSRRVFWQSDKILATPGGRCPCQGIGFELAITPSAADINKIPVLLDELVLQGADDFTGEEILVSLPPLTTNLVADNLAKGKSAVQP